MTENRPNPLKANRPEQVKLMFAGMTNVTTASPQQPTTTPNLMGFPYPNLGWESSPLVTVQLNLEQLSFVVNQFVRAAAMDIALPTAVDEDDWSLTVEQMLFMFQNHNMIESASSDEDIEHVRDLAASDEFASLFGEMGIDEAWDRYLTMLEEGRA